MQETLPAYPFSNCEISKQAYSESEYLYYTCYLPEAFKDEPYQKFSDITLLYLKIKIDSKETKSHPMHGFSKKTR